jgi:hypothetical protein
VRAAVVEIATNIVVNVIVVESLNDISPDGCFLVDADHAICAIGWAYDPVINDFIDPSPPPIVGDIDAD